MEVLEQKIDALITGSHVWTVRPDHIDDLLRICITPSHAHNNASRAGMIIAADAELSAGFLASTTRSCAVGLDLPSLYAVSIGYPLAADPPFGVRRNRDLTPSAWPEFDRLVPFLSGGSQSLGTGGGAAFLAFIEDELKPALAESFPVDPTDSTLVGQSFGGLFVLQTLLTRPDAFRRYLAVSPSLWWSDRLLLTQANGPAARCSSPQPRVYMCVGELENRARFAAQFSGLLNSPAGKLVPEAMLKVDMPGDMFVMRDLLRQWIGDERGVEAHVFPEESHESIMGAALSRGLRRLYGTL